MVARRSAIFPFLTGNSFFGQIWSKIKIVSLNWNLALRLIQICWIQWWCSLFPFLTGKLLLGKLGQKMKIVKLIWNLVPRLIRICRIQWCGVHFIYFRLETPFLDKLGPTNKNTQFKLKFGTYIQNSMTLFTFFWFRSETLFSGKFGPKNQNCQFKLKFGT